MLGVELTCLLDQRIVFIAMRCLRACVFAASVLTRHLVDGRARRWHIVRICRPCIS